MEIQEKLNKVEDLFNQQKKVLSELNIKNFGESMIEMRKLELQKEIVKAIPNIKKASKLS